MTDVCISSAVMTHPRRLSRARELAAALGLDAVVVNPNPDGPPSALRTALAAWAAAAPGATHHLVLQDDVAALVHRSVRRHPADALAFHAGWNTRNGSAVRLAALVGAGWVRGVPEEFTPAPAVCLPVAMAEEFRRYARGSADRHDDEVLSAYLRPTGRTRLIAVPNPVTHIDKDSIAGFDRHGVRRSACLSQEPGIAAALETGWVLERPGGLPCMRRGEGHARVEGPDGIVGARGHAHWTVALPYLGGSEEQVHRLVRDHRPADAAAAVGRGFGHHFADELWIHCPAARPPGGPADPLLAGATAATPCGGPAGPKGPCRRGGHVGELQPAARGPAVGLPRPGSVTRDLCPKRPPVRQRMARRGVTYGAQEGRRSARCLM